MNNSLKGFFAGFTGTDTHDMLQIVDKNLAVADLACTGGGLDCFNRTVDDRVVHGCFDFCLRQKINDVFGTAIQLGMPLLATKPLTSVTVIP
jgi:hypothetical protein